MPFHPVAGNTRHSRMEQNDRHDDDFAPNVFSISSYPSNQSDAHVSSGDKGWGTLLFSGIFLALVGIALTVLAWVNNKQTGFDWTRLVGPILLIAGAMAVLISVGKFMMLTSCKPCKSTEETPLDTEQLSGGQSFVFTGINQPITFHGATVVQYIPPPYSTHDFTGGATPISSNPNSNHSAWANGTALGPPQYYNIYPMDNPAFVQDDPSPAQLSMTEVYDSLPDAAWLSEDFLGTNRTNELPPSYDEIFPTVRGGTADYKLS
ncbi:transmembrane protein 174 isoform X2 [Xenopus tropicalis]|uniref:Transmembrane protein 174 isoform X2 n=1 Tax=Xenopus tropicalis TaxID=8364 RepID=A0A8J1IXT4_XENTR|nr:transmembrane protein 174 isoform X2 [Xenopus tropicalis]